MASKIHLFPGLTLDESSEDFVDGKVVGVSHDLYMKGCVEDVSEGIKVRNLPLSVSLFIVFHFLFIQLAMMCITSGKILFYRLLEKLATLL